MKKLNYLILAVLAAAAVARPLQAAETETAMSSEWKKIPITEVKNPVSLFRDDWMALAVGKEGDMNAMTVGWGQIGVLWGRPIVTVYVAPDRYTYDFLERNAYFTVTGFPETQREALTYIGTHSGRDGDKLKEAGLNPEFTDMGNPVFKEGNLAIECKIIYKEPFKQELLDEKAKDFYDTSKLGLHVAYIGEIINVWKKD